MSASRLPLIPSTVVGSHGKPSWWYVAVKPGRRRLGQADLEEMLDDAADSAIRDMERAGLDVITDGEVRRLDGYVDSYYTVIQGIQPIPIRRKDGPWGYDQQTRYVAIGKIETPEGGLGIIDEFKYTMAHTEPGAQGDLRRPADVRLADPPRHHVQGRWSTSPSASARSSTPSSRDWWRPAPNSSSSTSRPAATYRPGDGPPLQPGH